MEWDGIHAYRSERAHARVAVDLLIENLDGRCARGLRAFNEKWPGQWPPKSTQSPSASVQFSASHHGFSMKTVP